MVSHPAYSGVSDGSQTPVVRVCEWQTTANGGACGQVVANFTTGGGTDGQAVSYDGTSQYQVNWHTNVCLSGSCTLDPTKTYRVRVLVGSQELGHADVQVVSNGSELKNVQTGDYIGLVDGRTLPVKFRLEQGAIIVVKAGVPAPITPAGGTVGSADGQTSVSIPAGALAATAPIAISAAPAAPAGGGAWTAPVDLEPTGTTFATPAALTLSFDPTQLPAGVTPSALGIFTVDANGSWAAVPNSAVNLVDNTVTAPISHFSYYTIGLNANVAHAPLGDVYIGINQSFTFFSWSYYYQTNTGQTCYYTYYGPFSTYNCYNVTQTYQYPVVNQTVQWQSSSVNVASFSGQYSATDAAGYTTSPPLNTKSYGDAVITATLVGETGPQGPIANNTGVHVEPHLRWIFESIKMSPWQKAGDALTLDVINAASGTVSLSYLTSGVVFGPDAIPLPAFSSLTSPVFLSPAGTGVTTVRASLPGYVSDDLAVSVGGLGNLQFAFGPTTLPANGTLGLSVLSYSADDLVRIGPITDEVFALSGSNVTFSDGVNPITSITVPALSTSPVSFVVRGTAPGPATVTLTNSHYNTATLNLTVTAPVGPFAFWRTEAAMNSARQAPATAMFGSTAYMIGGWDGNGNGIFGVESLDLSNPSAHWVSTTPLPFPLGYGIAAVGLNKIYFFGGGQSSGAYNNETYSLDPSSPGAWNTSLPLAIDPTYGARWQKCGGAFFYNSLFYVFSGCDGSGQNTFMTFNPDPSAPAPWSPSNASPSPHGAPAGVAMVGSKIYVIGGEGDNGAVDIYDVGTGTWSPGPRMPVARQHGAATVIGTKIYIFGGSDGSTLTTDIYQLDTDPTNPTPWSVVGKIPQPLDAPGVVQYGGRVYLIGGFVFGTNSVTNAVISATP